MYAGIGAQLMRSFPIHAINFLVYEQVLLVCRGGNGGYGDGNNGGGI